MTNELFNKTTRGIPEERSNVMKNIWKTGIMGVIVGDALGCPVQFESREEVATHPVKGMTGFGTFNLPAGSWTDDSSLTLALAHSIAEKKVIDLHDTMERFVMWLVDGEYTPYGYAYDIGRSTMEAINKYIKDRDEYKCGGRGAYNNGNGSIMRIMPAVLYCITRDLTDDAAVKLIHAVSALTHAHIRAKIACGLYYFMAKAIVQGEGTLLKRLQSGLDAGFAFYENAEINPDELNRFARLRNLSKFGKTPELGISTSGYVVDTIEAAVWALINTDLFPEALLCVVNMGGDTDSIAAVAGGLAALYYGYDGIPVNWLGVIQRREWIEWLIKPLDAA